MIVFTKHFLSKQCSRNFVSIMLFVSSFLFCGKHIIFVLQSLTIFKKFRRNICATEHLQTPHNVQKSACCISPHCILFPLGKKKKCQWHCPSENAVKKVITEVSKMEMCGNDSCFSNPRASFVLLLFFFVGAVKPDDDAHETRGLSLVCFVPNTYRT